MHNFFFEFLQTHRNLGYLFVFLAMIVEGDLTLFTAAFLTHRGYFDLTNMLLSVLTGVMIGDLWWYELGRKLNKSSSFFARWAKKLASPFDDHLKNRTLHTIFLSKFTYGLHHAILVRAGSLRLRLHEYLRDDFIAAVFWILVIGGLGFISSLSYTYVRHYLKFGEIALLTALIGFVIVMELISWRSRKKL